MRLNARFKLVVVAPVAINNSSMATNKEKLGNKIQKLRKQLGYSQEALAEKINISRTHMGHIEQGRKSPSIKVLERLAKSLRVQVKDIFPF